MKITSEYKESMKKMVNDKNVNLTTNHNIIAKYIIGLLAKKDIPFRLINLGAGVKRITTDVDICPKCNGTGRC